MQIQQEDRDEDLTGSRSTRDCGRLDGMDERNATGRLGRDGTLFDSVRKISSREASAGMGESAVLVLSSYY